MDCIYNPVLATMAQLGDIPQFDEISKKGQFIQHSVETVRGVRDVLALIIKKNFVVQNGKTVISREESPILVAALERMQNINEQGIETPSLIEITPERILPLKPGNIRKLGEESGRLGLLFVERNSL
jgi:hypothetical protein